VTLAVYQPSSPSQATLDDIDTSSSTSSFIDDNPHLSATTDHNERHPRRVHAIADLRSALPSNESLPPAPHPPEGSTTALPAPQPLAPSITISTTSSNTNPYPNPSTNSYPTPIPRSFPPPSPGPSPSSPSPLPPRDTDSHTFRTLIRRYEELSHTHEREFHSLLDRLERLERANERWLGAVEPLFECLGPGRLIAGDGSRDGSRRRSPRGSLCLGLRRRDSASSVSSWEDGEEGLAARERGMVPALLDLLERVSAFGREPDGRRCRRRVNDGLDDGDVNINDESWLSSDSDSGNCSVSASGESVLDNGHWMLGSGESLRGGAGGWKTTFTGRRAEPFARDQQRRREREYLDDLDYDEEVTSHIEDPSGWDALETVMRDLVLGSRHGDDSIEGSTLFG
jgi:hypothetical protein